MVVAVESPMTGAVVVSGEPARPRSLWQRVTATPHRPRLADRRFGCRRSRSDLRRDLVRRSESPKRRSSRQASRPTARSSRPSPTRHSPSWTHRPSAATRPYRGVEPWVAENAQGSRCLMAIVGSTLWGIRCAPPEAELMLDLGACPLDPAAVRGGTRGRHGDPLPAPRRLRRRLPVSAAERRLMAESSPAVSAEPAAKAMPWSLVALVAGAAVAVGAIIATVAWCRSRVRTPPCIPQASNLTSS